MPETSVLQPTHALIDLNHLRHNARVLMKAAAKAELMAVVKADAYGHGAVPVVRTLQDAGIRYFAVAILPEAIALREAGIDDDILVFGAPLQAQLAAYQRYNIQINVTSDDVAGWVSEAAASGYELRVHVKVNTGMNRLGLSTDSAPGVINRLSAARGVTVEGVWTHLATADEPGDSYPAIQVERFRTMLSALGTPPRSVHVANSAGLLMVPETLSFPASFPGRVLARPGIALYGLMNEDAWIDRFNLRPVMTLFSRVQHLQTIGRGESVSYGRTWTAPERTTIATIGAGYADGYPRIVSNRAEVVIGGQRRPVAGRVCMDMTMAALGTPDKAGVRDDAQSDVRVGDPVVMFGDGGPSAAELAKWAETIPYEICCGISARVPRIYVGASEAGM